jgi:hypothetical protein
MTRRLSQASEASTGDNQLPLEISEKINELKLGEDTVRLYRKLREDLRSVRDPARLRKNYRKNHEFLSQQIDERSHQVWTLGSLFVPVSFLIFTYTILNDKALLLDRFLLMVASLTCYLIFYFMYRRITLLNDSSYSYIHALELVLGLDAHLKLKKFWNKRRFLQWRVSFFSTGLNVLAAIWTIHLSELVVFPLIWSALSSPDPVSRSLDLSVPLAFCCIPIIVVRVLLAMISVATRTVVEQEQDSKISRAE